MKSTLLVFSVLTISVPVIAGQPLSMNEAVALAEKFIAENGYTNLPSSKLKPNLDLESITFTSSRSALIKERFNTLLPKAIGAHGGAKGKAPGWSIAFDYHPSASTDKSICRVVTMASDGSKIKVEHQDGIREYFVGFHD